MHVNQINIDHQAGTIEGLVFITTAHSSATEVVAGTTEAISSIGQGFDTGATSATYHCPT